jgi:hypothetical protein
MIDSRKTEELFSALQHLRYNKHEVLLFHVTDHKPGAGISIFSNRPHKFVDLESGQVSKI